MIASLRAWYEGLEQHDRRVLTLGGVVALSIVLLGSMWALNRAVDNARQRTEQKQRDLVFAQNASAEILAAGPVRQPGAAGEPLVVTIDRAARESGLAQSLGATEAVADGVLRVRFNRASFDALISMVARLAQQSGISITAASVERSEDPGAVNASLSLRSGAADPAQR
jgi:type II secretory pathway component PulM